MRGLLLIEYEQITLFYLLTLLKSLLMIPTPSSLAL